MATNLHIIFLLATNIPNFFLLRQRIHKKQPASAEWDAGLSVKFYFMVSHTDSPKNKHSIFMV